MWCKLEFKKRLPSQGVASHFRIRPKKCLWSQPPPHSCFALGHSWQVGKLGLEEEGLPP